MLRRLRALFHSLSRRERLHGDLDEELRFYLEQLTEEKQAAGMTPAEARLQARREVGSLEPLKERVRDASASTAVETLWRDTRHAFRIIRKNPGFSVIVVLTLTLGIGANTAIFTVFNAVLWRVPAGIQHPDHLVEIYQGDGTDYVDVSYPMLLHLRKHSTTVSDLAAVASARVVLAQEHGPEVVSALQVTGNYFSVLGMSPAAGTFFSPGRSFHPAVGDDVVISHRLWTTHFAADRSAVGSIIRVNGRDVRVLGVAPEGFHGHQNGVRRDLYVLMGTAAPGLLDAGTLDDPRSNEMTALARLAPGAGGRAATEELTALAERYAVEHIPERPRYPIRADPYGAVGSSRRGAIAGFFSVLLGIVGLILAIACVNVTNMFLSRGTERRREMAIRLAIGAGRGRIVRQLLTESLVLFLLAAGAGLLLAGWATRLLATLLPPVARQIELDLSPDLRVLGFTVTITLITGILSGLVPALRSTRPGLVSDLKGGVGAASPRRSRLRRLLVTVQVCGVLVLLVSAGLFLRALRTAQQVELGFRPQGVQTAQFDLSMNGYDADRASVFFGRLLDQVRARQEISHASLAHKLPLASQSMMGGIQVDGVEPPGPYGYNADFLVVGDDYFRTVGIPLLRGRGFSETDLRTGPRVAVINDTMARQLWPGVDAVGRTFRQGGGEAAVSYRVIGVATDARYHALIEETPRFVYLPFSQHYRRHWSRMFLLARSATAAAIPPLTVPTIVKGLDAGVPLLGSSEMSQEVANLYLPQRMAAWVTGVVGVLGLLLGAVGIYGVTAYTVSQRRQEMGVRVALGASSVDVLGLVVRQGMVPPLIGVGAGVLLAVAGTRLLRGLLVGVSPLDPWTFALVIAALLVVALCANLVPARRAMRVDPVSTLRCE